MNGSLNRSLPAKIRQTWARHGAGSLRVAIVWMFIAAAVWLPYQFWRLLFQTSGWGATDLMKRCYEVQRWLEGVPLYGQGSYMFDPPATLPLLFPLVGGLSATSARWVWALTTLAALGGLIFVVLRASGAETPLARAFVALMPCSMYATGATIGNGQVIVHLLPALLTAFLLLGREPASWRHDLLIAALFLFALAKPTVSAPFFWVLLFHPKGLRPAILVTLGYIALTLFALSPFQTLPGDGLLHDSLVSFDMVAQNARGQTNLHDVLKSFALERYTAVVALGALGLFGWWIHRHRRADLWLQLSIAALGARFWTYHRWYDDLLILVPMVTLFRIAKGDDWGDRGPAAGFLLALLIPAMIAPGGLYLLPAPWNSVYQIAQAILWITTLIFLADCARRSPPNTSVTHGARREPPRSVPSIPAWATDQAVDRAR